VRRAVRVGVFTAFLAVLLLAGGCGDNKPVASATEASAETLKKDCTDPQWKEKNLGLWYSVCRKPLQW
jgi:hypothetical protein